MRVSQKVKGLEPQRHKGTKEDFFCLPGVAQTSTEKTLCLRVFVVPFFSGAFATTSLWDDSDVVAAAVASIGPVVVENIRLDIAEAPGI